MLATANSKWDVCNLFGFQLQDEIQQLRQKLQEKEAELAEIKKQLGITAFTEFKQSMAHGLKVVEQKFKDVQESETWAKLFL